MRLKIKKKEKALTLLVAEKDITCYKVLRQPENIDNIWISPYQHAPYELNKLMVDEGEIYRFGTGYGPGMLHTYSNLGDALEDAAVSQAIDAKADYILLHVNNHTVFYPPSCITYGVVECIIPKGTEYYEGMDFIYKNYSDGWLGWTLKDVPSYGSKKLYVTDKIFEVKVR